MSVRQLSNTRSHSLVSVAEVMRYANIYVGHTLPAGMYQSLPMPAKASSGLVLSFLFGRGEVLNGETKYQVWPPRYVALFACATGRFEKLVAVTPDSFDRSDNLELPLGPGIAPPRKMQPDYLNLVARYAQSVDRLLPAFASGEGISIELQADVEATLETFALATETPLRAYYEQLGAKFLNWLRMV